jgi:hypothetical protein
LQLQANIDLGITVFEVSGCVELLDKHFRFKFKNSFIVEK